MKKHSLFFAFVIGVMTLNAQPVLQQANLATPGLSATVNVGTGVPRGSAGANQTWNYSTASVSPAGTLTFVNPASTPCAANFSTAGWCFSLGTNYNYFNVSSSQMEQTGNSIPVGCNGEVYSNPKTIMIFPFNYNASNSDTWVSNQGSGTYVAKYDGYGTLITPFATYTNVVRLTNVDGTDTSTVWLNSNPIYQIMIIDDNNTTVILSNETTGIQEQNKNNLVSVVPNPSNGIFTLTTQQIIPAATVTLYNCLGQEIYSIPVVSEKTDIDLSEKNAGIYFYNLISEGRVVAQGKLVVQ